MSLGKKIIIATAVFVVICGGAVTLAILNRKADPKPLEQKATTSPQSLDLSFQVKNFSSYPDIDDDTKAAVKNGINHYLEDIARTSAPIGVIRDNSYSKTTSESLTTTAFMIDIASLKRSYKISSNSDSSTGQQSLYVLCPSNSEMIYPPFDCKDDLSEE